MEPGTLNVILDGLKTTALIFTLADMLGEATAEKLGDTLGDVEPKAVLHTLPHTQRNVER